MQEDSLYAWLMLNITAIFAVIVLVRAAILEKREREREVEGW